MKTIILVHGAFADASAWGYVKPLLEQAAEVVTVQLAGRGADAGNLGAVELSTYVDQVKAAVLEATTPVVLVGHSMAGMVVSQVAQDLPDHIDQLVYLAAYLPQNGESLQELAQQDADSLIGPNMVFAPDWSSVTVKPDALPMALAADLPADVQDYIVASHKPEPLHPFQGTVTLTADRYGRVRKHYIRTLQDRAVTTGLQQKMLAAAEPMPVYDLQSGHLPFLSQPAELARILLEIAHQ